MSKRILVAIQNPQQEQEISHVALQLARENDARILWVHVLNNQDSSDNKLFQSLHDQSMMWEIESDTAQIRGSMTSVLQQQIIKWSPDLIIIGKEYLLELMSLFVEIGNVEIYRLEPDHPWIVLKLPCQPSLVNHQQFISPKLVSSKMELCYQ